MVCNRKSLIEDAIIKHLVQPMTASQISSLLGVKRRACSEALVRLAKSGKLRCLNPRERSCRLYWHRRRQLKKVVPGCADLDWNLYGWACYRHRAAVVRAMLDRPMRAVDIRKRAVSQNPGLRMSANNARDILWEFVAKGLARKVRVRRPRHVHYELSDVGRAVRRLLLGLQDIRCQ